VSKIKVTFLSSATYFRLQFPLLVCFYLHLLIVYFRFVTCLNEELLNIQLMLMDYILKHSRDHADLE